MADRVTKALLSMIALLLLALMVRQGPALPPAQAQTLPAVSHPPAQVVAVGNSVCVLRGDQLYLYSVRLAGDPSHTQLTLEDTRVIGARP